MGYINYTGVNIALSDITFEYENPGDSTNGVCDFAGEIYMWVDSAPSGSIPDFIPDPHSKDGSKWILNTDLAGEYTIKGRTTVECQNADDITNDTASITLLITSSTESLNQTHEFVRAPSGDCDMVGILVKGIDQDSPPNPMEFNVINGINIALTTEYTIEKPRDESFEVTIENGTFNRSNTKNNIDTVPFMGEVYTSGDFQDVTVTLAIAPNEYEYEFEQDNWTTLNKYSYNIEGSFAINVRDKYGCTKKVYYESNLLPVVDPTIQDPFFYVSKANSIRMAERVDFDDNYKTDENTFAKEVDYFEVLYGDPQMVKRAVILPTQIKSNYDTHTATLHNCLSGETKDLPVVLKQENILFEDVKGCLYTQDEQYTYLYFEDGKIPYYYEIGATITVNTIDRVIRGVDFLIDQDAYAIKVDVILGLASPVYITYIYNREVYNVYEFELDTPNELSGNHYITLEMTRANETDLSYQSNILNFQVEFPDTVDIYYWNDNNTDILWSTDIKMLQTVGLESRSPVLENELEVVKNDRTNFLKKGLSFEKFQYRFDPLTLELMRKLEIGLIHGNLFINSIGYAVESIEAETLNTQANQYILTAILYKSNQNTTFISGVNTFDFSSGTVKFDSSITWDRTTY